MARKGFFARLFDWRHFIGYNQFKMGADYLKSVGAGILKTPDKNLKETFEESVVRQDLSDEHLDEMQKIYFRNAIYYFFLGLVFAAHSLYRFYMLHLAAGFVSLLLAILIFASCVTSHFWYYQIKNRKLGCTFKEWYNNTIV